MDIWVTDIKSPSAGTIKWTPKSLAYTIAYYYTLWHGMFIRSRSRFHSPLFRSFILWHETTATKSFEVANVDFILHTFAHFVWIKFLGVCHSLFWYRWRTRIWSVWYTYFSNVQQQKHHRFIFTANSGIRVIMLPLWHQNRTSHSHFYLNVDLGPFLFIYYFWCLIVLVFGKISLHQYAQTYTHIYIQIAMAFKILY